MKVICVKIKCINLERLYIYILSPEKVLEHFKQLAGSDRRKVKGHKLCIYATNPHLCAKNVFPGA